MKQKLAIAFRGIADGFHEYDFRMQKSFFDSLSYSEFDDGDLELHVRMEKRNNILTMDLHIKGNVMVCCDRCLDYFPMDVDYEGTVYAKYISDINENDSDDDIIELKDNDNEVDLTHYVYESICLSLPIKRIHGIDSNGESLCNKEMMNILSKHLIIE